MPSFISRSSDDTLTLKIDTSVYSLSSVFRSCYKFTDRCYIFLARSEENENIVSARLTNKDQSVNLEDLSGEFYNELLDNQLREVLAAESGQIRDLIVAQAFSEGNLLEPSRDELDYEKDPLGIGQHRE